MIPVHFYRPARKLIEVPFARPARLAIMMREAKRDESFATRQAHEASVKLLDLGELASRCRLPVRGDSFYVLGSGSTIEDLSEANFQEIARHTSVGINNWGVHPFVPDMYSLESVPWVGDGQDFVRAMQLLDRRDILSRQPDVLILRPKTSHENAMVRFVPAALRESVSFYGRVIPSTRDSRNLAGDIAQYFFRIAPEYPSVVMDSGASVVRMVTLGILLGFRRIVLCGVDLNGSPYFWERNPEYLSDLDTPAPVNNQKNTTHETNSSSNRPFGVTPMLTFLDEFLRGELGGELLVTSPESALAEYLPLETWRGT